VDLSLLTANYKQIQYYNVKNIDSYLYLPKIFLNGEEVEMVLEANSIEGWIKNMKFDLWGQPTFINDNNSPLFILATEAVHGTVLIFEMDEYGNFKEL